MRTQTFLTYALVALATSVYAAPTSFNLAVRQDDALEIRDPILKVRVGTVVVREKGGSADEDVDEHCEEEEEEDDDGDYEKRNEKRQLGALTGLLGGGAAGGAAAADPVSGLLGGGTFTF
jgi:hypothetical protein